MTLGSGCNQASCAPPSVGTGGSLPGGTAAHPASSKTKSGRAKRAKAPAEPTKASTDPAQRFESARRFKDASRAQRDLEKVVGVPDKKFTKVFDQYQSEDFRDDGSLGYYEINDTLRGKKVNPHEKIDEREIGKSIDALTTAIEQAPRTTEDVVLFRGMELEASVVDQFLPGALITDPGFMSMTARDGVAEEFAQRESTKKKLRRVVVHVLVPAGSQAVTPPLDMNEAEVITQRGSSLRILGVGKQESRWCKNCIKVDAILEQG